MNRMNKTQQEAMLRVLDDVTHERLRQHAEWGEQDLPRGDVAPTELQVVLEVARQRNDRGEPSWESVLLEEVVEAIAERNPRALRAELVQVAAVACQWVEAIDRAAGALVGFAEQISGGEVRPWQKNALRSYLAGVRPDSLQVGPPMHLEPQPPPKPSEGPSIEEELVATVRRTLLDTPGRAKLIEDIRARAAQGRAKYGVPLQVGNGRDHVIDEYQEEIDAAFYAQARVLQLEDGDERARSLTHWRLQRILETAILTRDEIELAKARG